jgi:hypothetical protein
VFVSNIGHLTWLEERVEILEKESSFIGIIAIDIEGHKFTNCSSIPHSFNYNNK